MQAQNVFRWAVIGIVVGCAASPPHVTTAHVPSVVDSPPPPLPGVERSFIADATLRKSDHPDLDGPAIEAVKQYIRDHASSTAEPVMSAVHGEDDRTVVDVAFRRPDGTCFVQPAMPLNDPAIARAQCESDGEKVVVHAVWSRAWPDGKMHPYEIACSNVMP